MTAQNVTDRIGSAVVRTDTTAMTLTLERDFDAARERVFAAFSSCDAISKWYGPAGWTVPACDMDFRPGGVWLVAMRAPAGVIGPEGEDPWDAWSRATYREIVEPERLVYLNEFATPDGAVAEGLPSMITRLDFIDQGGRTRLVDTTTFSSVEDLEAMVEMGMAQGDAESFEDLARYLAETAD